ncbi:PD-(D/E)XK nuclease family protein [Bifidobacterium sp. 82T10]|uniref:PD-(D/E)XK nuclease family protein n=1 Tax=Bifidobacterium miconis TaxID=2834435 RepID=A0ABS6WHE3_9BIFI|nr:PD-(D/E)XK nuclease family protein [Bifidobacterium miconis]MBW3093453.1 PD-(D/E)XK nuclease family protein [Bifidobacterium miconis]
MGLNILETDGGEDSLDALISRAAADMAADRGDGVNGVGRTWDVSDSDGASADGVSKSTGPDEADRADRGDERFIMITPARLRPYAERRVLAYLRDHPVGRPGVTLEVHSFTSMARSVIGNRYGGRYAKPMVNPFTLRAFLASRMRHDPRTFRTAGETFGSANQFAVQVTELINAGIRPDDINDIPDADDRMRALAKLLALMNDEFGDFTMPGANARVIAPWAKDHGDGLHVYLYGFEWMTADEMLATAALAESADCVLCTEWGCRPDFVDALLPADGPTARGTDAIPPLLHATVPSVYSAADECDEIRQVACMIDLLRERADEHGEPFSYGDVLVTARNVGPYQAMLATEFAYHGIPVNATPTATMADQPFAGLLLGLLDERLYDDVPDATVLSAVFRSRLLRGRYRFSDRDLDRVKDALYASDPAKVWAGASPSHALNDTVSRMRELIDEARPVFAGIELEPARTVQETLTGMVRFLVRIGANLSWQETVTDDMGAAESDDARVHGEAQERLFSQTRTVWNLVMREFDALADRFGDEPFADFQPMFRDNLETLLLEQPLHDQARASNAVDVVAFPTPMRPYRHVFVLGATESQLPAIPGETGLLDESERLRIADALAGQGNVVAAAGLRSGTVHSKARREVSAFNRVARYAREVTMLCPRTAGGTAQSLSPFAAALLSDADRDGVDGPVGAPTLDSLPAAVDGTSHPLALRSTDDSRLDPGLMIGLFTRPSDASDESSPRVLDTSVSAVQSFYANPFETFLSRGLKVQPVKPFTFDPATKGSFYHAVLERLIDVKIAARQHDGDTSAIPAVYRDRDALKTDGELIDLFARLDFRPEPIAGSTLATDSLLEANPEFEILASSRRMNAVREQLKDTLRMFLHRLDLTVASWQSNLLDETVQTAPAKKRGKTATPAAAVHDEPLFTEKQFGDIHGTSADWPALTSHITGTQDGAPVDVTVRVRGKVDRIDRIERDGHEGSLVIDYKSSPHVLFDADGKTPTGTHVYYGHELQLLNYARAVMASGETMPPIAGMIFLPIREKSSDAKVSGEATDLQPAGESPRELAATICGTGLRLKEHPALHLATAGTLIGPWKCGKAASLPQQVLSPDELQLLCDHARRMIDAACEAMLSGDLPVAPYRLLKGDSTEVGRDGLKYSDYPDVMALDMLDESAWRMQRPVSLDGLLDAARNGTVPDPTGRTTGMIEEEER